MEVEELKREMKDIRDCIDKIHNRIKNIENYYYENKSKPEEKVKMEIIEEMSGGIASDIDFYADDRKNLERINYYYQERKRQKEKEKPIKLTAEEEQAIINCILGK